MNKRFPYRLVAVLVVLCAALLLSPQTSSSQSSTAHSDDTLRLRIQAALGHVSDLNGAQITVAVREGVVTLSGQVSSKKLQDASYPEAGLKQNLRSIVRGFPDVKDVVFSLQVDNRR